MRVIRACASATVVLFIAGTSAILTTTSASAEPCGGLAGTGITGVGMPGQIPSGHQGSVPTYSGPNTSTVSWLTGPSSINDTYQRFGISGADVGLTWDNGAGQTLITFGDTFGDCTVFKADWRHQVLLRSSDSDLSDGMTLDEAVTDPLNPRRATQLLPDAGPGTDEITAIPTAAIAVDGVQYMSVMSVRTWSGIMWSTNYSGLATSRDNGTTWVHEPSTRRVNVGGNDRFQQAAFLRGNDGMVYQYGTPNGRLGAVFLSRVAQASLLDLTQYQYFTGSGWSPDVAAASPIVGDPVGEFSVAWNAYLNKYVMLHGNDLEGKIVLRTSDHPEGPWSAPTTVVDNSELGWVPGHGLYAPYIHPKSSGRDLYFTASQYSSYNVILMKTNLDAIPH